MPRLRPKKRVLGWKDAREKAAWLDAAAGLDAHHPEIRELAGRFARAANSNDPTSIAFEIHKFVRDSIQYVRDPRDPAGGEEFADSATVLRRGFDDCDGKSRLCVALMRAAGLEARILPVFKGVNDFVHVQSEVKLPNHPRAQADGWVRCEVIVRGVELGEDPNDKREPDGKIDLT